MVVTPPRPQAPLTEERRQKVTEMVVDELGAAWLYDQLSRRTEPKLAQALREMADSEREHAAHWCALLGSDHLLLNPPPPSFRRRLMAWWARFGGLGFVIDQLRREELTDIRRYEADPDAGTLADEEREHRATLASIDDQIGHEEALAGQSSAGAFRATLFGLNDGIVSNLALVAGVAGVAIDSDVILVAGIGGWLAGAFSMAAGEYISVRSQAELQEQQIAHERDELLLDPAEERAELVRIYRRKGLSQSLAEQVADELMADPATALDTLAREELGLDPSDLGSPVRAAAGSFTAFSLGAIVPVIPFLVAALAGWTPGWWTLIAAVAACATLLGVAGVLSSFITSRHPLYAAARSVAVGLLATAVTFGIGAALPFDL